jgi:hypothetical protein
MESSEIVIRKPRLLGVIVRTALITFLLTLLTFALSLLVGILGMLLMALIRGIHPDLTQAYRHVAFPVAMVATTVALVVAFVGEFRRYRKRLAMWRGF